MICLCNQGKEGFARQRKAFTLVELLVVIAIITILAALLMPTLENAITQSRISVCSGQLRQLYIGMMWYADSHNDALSRNDDGRGSSWSWAWASIANDGGALNSGGIQRHGAWLIDGAIPVELYFCPGLSFESHTGGASGYMWRKQLQTAWTTPAARQFFSSAGASGSAARQTLNYCSYGQSKFIYPGGANDKARKLGSSVPVLTDFRGSLDNIAPSFVHHNGLGYNVLAGDGAVNFLMPGKLVEAGRKTSASSFYTPWIGTQTFPNYYKTAIDLSINDNNNPFNGYNTMFWDAVKLAKQSR